MNPSPFVYHMPDKNQEALDNTNKACYDSCTATWDRFPFPNTLPAFLEKYYNPSLGKRVLDVGSGTGVLAEWLKDQGFDVLCIDPSSAMVRRCHAKGLKTEQLTLQEYQPQESFGMIFAILSMIHVPKSDFSAQLKKMADALPEGGLLFLGMLEGKGEGFYEGPSYPRFFAYYTPEEISNKIKPYFQQIDYSYLKGGGVGYMLFVLKKNAYTE